MTTKHILILAIGFRPNVGGLETHLDDLINELNKKEWIVTVLTYQPLNTPALGKWIEKNNKITVYRLPSIRGLFYALLKFPILEFIFLCPLQFLFTPLVLLRCPDISVINAQGLISGFSAAFWSKIFGKRYVIATQSVYDFPKNGIYKKVVKWIFNRADKILAISKQSAQGVIDLGVSKDKVVIFTHWEDVEIFKPQNKLSAKKKLKINSKVLVSFFGRLVYEKGITVLVEAIPLIKNDVTLAIYGEGPLKETVIEQTKKYKNVFYMGTISPNLLPLHYSAADLIVVPSLHQEGFGRVAAGALLCGTPVIASDRGALPEVINNSVGRIIKPTSSEIAEAINFYNDHIDLLKKQSAITREYAIKKFSPKNAQVIISILES